MMGIDPTKQRRHDGGSPLTRSCSCWKAKTVTKDAAVQAGRRAACSSCRSRHRGWNGGGLLLHTPPARAGRKYGLAMISVGGQCCRFCRFAGHYPDQRNRGGREWPVSQPRRLARPSPHACRRDPRTGLADIHQRRAAQYRRYCAAWRRGDARRAGQRATRKTRSPPGPPTVGPFGVAHGRTPEDAPRKSPRSRTIRRFWKLLILAQLGQLGSHATELRADGRYVAPHFQHNDRRAEASISPNITPANSSAP